MRTLWPTIVLSVWGTQCSLGKGVGAIGAQQHRPNKISQKSRVPLQAVVPCLALICRNQSPIYKYFEIQLSAPQPIRTQREFYQAPADGTQLELVSHQLLSSDCEALHLTTKSGSSSHFRIQAQNQTVFPYFLLHGPYMVFFFSLCSYRPDSLFAPVSAGAGFLLSGTPAPFSCPLPPRPALQSTVSSSLLCPVEVFSHLATQNLAKLLRLLEISHEPLVKLTQEVDEKSVRAEHLGP